jgi:NADH-quinone oxidoreductase subunit N
MEFTLPQVDVWKMAPEIFLFLWACGVITFDLATRRRSGAAVGYASMAGLLITGLLLFLVDSGDAFGLMYRNVGYALFFKIIFLSAAFMAIGSSFGLTENRIVNHRGEFFGLILYSTVGMMFLASSEELLSLYIGLELTTIPLFVCAAFFKDDRFSVESGIKYLIVGGFSSALLLYGLSFLYGLTGTTNLHQMQFNIAQLWESSIGTGYFPLLVPILAIVMVVAGMGFKLSIPPFHQWAPDVYEGAPTPIAAFLSVGSKAAGVVAFAKVMLIALGGLYGREMQPNDWGLLVGVLASAAMIWGNVAAIRQGNIKRMLAYSSIAHAGYVLIGLLAVNDIGWSSVSFYMFAYLFANMGAFAVVAIFEHKTGSTSIDSYRGLAHSSPFYAFSLTIFLLSLAGIPPLAGFLGKYYVFAAAIKMAGSDAAHQWLYWLVGIGLLTSVFALYYYANVIKSMFFAKEESSHKLSLAFPGSAIVVLGLIGILLFGLYPNLVLDLAGDVPSWFVLYGN